MVDLTRPRWFEGVARILDLGGTFDEPVVVVSPEDAWAADARALAQDWAAVGDDLRWFVGGDA